MVMWQVDEKVIDKKDNNVQKETGLEEVIMR